MKDSKYWILLIMVMACALFADHHTARASGGTESLAVGESLQSVNTAVYSIDVEVSGIFDYAVYDAGGNYVDMGREVASTVVSIASGDKIVITNQDSSTLTVSGLTEPPDKISNPALKIHYLAENQTFTVSSGTVFSVFGQIDYVFGGGPFADLGTNSFSSPTVLNLSSSSIITNSDSRDLELYGPYDKFQPQYRADPALRKVWLFPEDNIYIPQAAKIRIGGTYDYSIDYDRSLYGRKQSGGDFTQYGQTTLTNSSDDFYEIVGIFDYFDPQFTMNPALSIMELASGESMQFTLPDYEIIRITIPGQFDYALDDLYSSWYGRLAAANQNDYAWYSGQGNYTITNSSETAYEVFGPFSKFSPVPSLAPALRILDADGSTNYEISHSFTTNVQLFKSFGQCTLDYAQYEAHGYYAQLGTMSGTDFWVNYDIKYVLDHPTCNLYGKFVSFQPIESDKPVKNTVNIEPDETVQFVVKPSNFSFYMDKPGLDVAMYGEDRSNFTQTLGYAAQSPANVRTVVHNPTSSKIRISAPYDLFELDMSATVQQALSKVSVPYGETLVLENGPSLIWLDADRSTSNTERQRLVVTVIKQDGQKRSGAGFGWIYPSETISIKNDNILPVTIVGPAETFNGVLARSGVHAEKVIKIYLPKDTDPEAMEADPVNAMTGAHMIARKLLSLNGVIPLNFQIQYNSLLLHDGVFGLGWEFEYGATLETTVNNEIIVNWSANRSNKFVSIGNDVFISSDPSMKGYRLVKDVTNTYTLTTHSQEQFKFDSNGRMTAWLNSYGQRILPEYDLNHRLTALTEPISNQSLHFEYNAQGLVSRIEAAPGREVQFSYDGSKRLVRITDAEGGEVNYTYNTDGRVLTAADENGNQQFRNSYDFQGRVIRQFDAYDNETTFQYGPLYKTTITNREGASRQIVFDDRYNLLRSTDELGNSTEYTYDSSGNRLSATDAEGRTTSWTYDANGNMLTSEDALGNIVTMTYDDRNNLLTIVDPLEHETTRTYDANNRLLSETDASGYVTSYQYNSDGLLSSATYADGTSNQYQYDAGKLVSVMDAVYQVSSYGYDIANRLITITDAAYHDTHMQYDQLGRAVSITDTLGNANTFVYDSSGNMLSKTDALGAATTFDYNLNGKRVSSTNALGQTITYEYDREDRLIRVIDPLEGRIEYVYDAKGRVSQKKDALGNTTQYQYDKTDRLTALILPDESIIGYLYDAAGRLVKQTDPAGNETHYVYDAVGNLLSMTDPLGHTTFYAYDDNNKRITATDPSGNVMHYEYDRRNRLAKMIDPMGYETKYEYDGMGRLIRVTDPLQRTTRYEYNALGQLLETINPMGYSRSRQYDDAGNLIGIKDAKGQQVLSRILDEAYRPIQEVDALGHVSNKQYDSLGRLIESTDALGRVAEYAYDSLNRLVAVTDADQSTSSRVFDANGNVVQIEDPNHNITRFEYDSRNRLIREVTSTGSEKIYRYDSRGLLIQETNSRGQSADYTYDAAGKVVGAERVEDTVQLQYDNNDRVTTITDQYGHVKTRDWDALNRLVSYTDEYGNTLHYEYDAVGNLVALTYPDGKIVTYTYDDLDRMTKVTDWEGRETRYEYDENNRLLAAYRPDGSKETRAYDSAGQLILLKDESISGEIIYQETYAYDAAGNVAATESSEERLSWTAIQPQEMTYAADNRLATYNGQQVIYDADGNMTYGPQAGGIGTYSYDSRNRLVQAGGISYHYDAESYRTAVTENGVTTRYVVNPNAYYSQVLMETDEQGQPKAYYIYGLGLVGLQMADGSYRAYHQDRRGSTVALSDEDGDVTDQYEYGIYGELASRDGNSPNPFLFNGRDGVMTDNNGLYFMRARYYNPEIKRFINRDVVLGSIIGGQTLNRYAYVNGNPISYVDPFGLARDGDAIKSGNEPEQGGVEAPTWEDINQTQQEAPEELIENEDVSVEDEEQSNIDEMLDYVQLGLDLAGFIPVGGAVADGLNALISLGRGDKTGAALSAIAAVPLVGDFAAVGKFFRKAVKLEKTAAKETEKLIAACNCFVAGTKVLTDEGEKNIEDIEVGDKVLSKNEETGEQAYKEVTHLYRNDKEIIYEMTVGDQVIETTDNHPFWVESEGWVLAADLQVGDKLQQSNGNTLTIDSIKNVKHEEKVKVYNFTVADFHTYFVSDLGIWVHNTGCITSGSYDGLAQNAKNAYDKYNKSGWKGPVSGQSAGTKAGGKYENSDLKLPTTGSNGTPITYREFDVNNKVAGQNRDSERFVVGSDGSIYYTGDHYGTFTQVK
ncbi:polymorphic toxin-type HINT domain-containing protein [Paenibacillus cymbidii]|uniref:polymorphic toxin-type HINT domain-containing protein n=1 Tax=Paenibacillus cymbidii TaxID=1639034 RepID=UPI00107FE3D0|nr:polymorphic toxin-type HINT domain-containing protein [Paenibacillus cymbidii]